MSSNAPGSGGRPSARPAIAQGEMLAGKFRVERIVGRGGMGVVIEATNVQLGQRVALKVLATGTDDGSAVERVSREARAAARLRSDHVARVYDVGKDTIHGPFIVMELLDGKTLAEVIASGRVPVHRAVEYAIDACEGLAEAHARGIVHQDVKPANLFLVTGSDGRGSIKLLDFGIATMRTKEREVGVKSSLPSSGTPAYLAPEQLRGAPTVDHRADVWALGCVLYELLVGERPFRAVRFTELVTKVLETPPHPFPEDLELPVQLADAIARCLEKDPAKRFASTGELALALLPFARRRAHSAVARTVAHVKTGGLDPNLHMPSSMPPPPSSSESPMDVLSSSRLRPPNVPKFSLDPAASPASTSALLASPGGHRRRVVGGLLALLLIGVGVAWMRLREPPSVGGPAAPSTISSVPAGSTVPSSSSVPVAASAIAPSASATPTSTSTPAIATSSVRTVGTPMAQPPARAGGSAPGSTTPSASAAKSTARPFTPESEIRHSR